MSINCTHKECRYCYECCVDYQGKANHPMPATIAGAYIGRFGIYIEPATLDDYDPVWAWLYRKVDHANLTKT